MAVNTKTRQLTRLQAQTWIEDRGIARLPVAGEQLEYVPAGRFNQYDLVRSGKGFELTSHILA